MTDTFARAVAGAYVLSQDLNQVFDAWEGVTDKGKPLKLTEVDSATEYALSAFNKEAAAGKHAYFPASDGGVIASAELNNWYFGKDVVVVNGVKIDGLALNAHGHSGDTGDGQPLTSPTCFADGIVGIAALAAGGMHLPQRQGGSATVWATSGTTDYTLTEKVQVLSGCVAMSGSWTTDGTGAEYATKTITFGTAFAYAPIVYPIVRIATLTNAAVFAQADFTASTTQIVLRVWHIGTTAVPVGSLTIGNVYVNWLAIGPKVA